jgi:hypothetical protein
MADKILQCGYMSGDTYTAAALLKLDPGVRILLVKDTKARGAYADKSGFILKIYQETGVIGQVNQIDISSTAIGIGEIWEAVKDKYSKSEAVPPVSPPPKVPVTPLENKLRELCHSYEPRGQWPRSITSVTGLLASRWQREPARTEKTIAVAWKAGLPTDLKIILYEYMYGKFKKINLDIRKNILVLWSRQSGKKGGAHLELDSSYEGIRQLAWYFAEENPRATVLLAGDEKNGKLADLATKCAQVVDVSEMWEDTVWKTHFGQAKFLAQFAFFKYLSSDYKIIHLGMRSGVLEAMALLGMETFYLEPISLATGSGKRMVAFQNNGITYKRVQINTPPGLTARIVDKKPFLYSQEKVEQQLARNATRHKSRYPFQRNFGGAGPATDKAARDFAKADLVERPGDYRTANLANDMNDLRGFRTSDFETITRLIGGAMM